MKIASNEIDVLDTYYRNAFGGDINHDYLHRPISGRLANVKDIDKMLSFIKVGLDQ